MVAVEKRRFPRLALKIDDGYFANVRLDDHGTLVASIVSLSADGLNLVVPPDIAVRLTTGDRLALRNIVGAANLSFLSDISAEIRWMDASASSPQTFVGCQLHGISPETREQLMRFIDSERVARGQYD
jgi:c-di-GMP-binding flagellar brake protein YcgR